MKFRAFHRQTNPEVAVAAPRVFLHEMPPAFKTYARFPQVPLPTPHIVEDSFSSLLAARETRRDYDPKKSISLSDISDILFCAGGINASHRENPKKEDGEGFYHRHHPSGGALYPLEFYVATYRVESLSQNIYHYAPRAGALEKILTGGEAPDVLDACEGLIPQQNPAAIIIITSMWGRNYLKYGEFAYRLSILEAGHATQNLLLAATARKLKAGPMAGFRQDNVSEALDLREEDTEDPLQLVFIGK